MKIEKLLSGSYRIRKMYKGKMYTVVFDRKPTQKEAMQAMEERNETRERVVCDYIAGMTDLYAITKFNEYYVPVPWQV